jgi:enoyl-CoA hydratase
MNGKVLMVQSDGVAWVTLHHPTKRNAMSRAMWQQLKASFDSLSSELNRDFHPIHGIVVRGEEGHFCAGGDISEYPEFRFQETSLREFHEDLVAPALQAMLNCDVPLFAQIEGNCMGGGLEIAACCDIRIAGQSATFGAPIAKLGMPMAPQELAIVLRAAGEASVREMLLEARVLTAQHMLQRGFVQRVVADDEVAKEVLETTQRISALSPQAARLNKQALRQFYMANRPLDQKNMAQEAINNVANRGDAYAYANSAEHKEGITAFLQKRVPKF